MPNLKSINGVEIFSAGTWNGDSYTVQDLDEMVLAFQETSETCRPYLKLGHDDDQKLLQSDGLPAAGWIGNLYRMGEKLVADFIDIPEKIYQLIENKAYRNVSSEIYWNSEMGDKTYNRMLAAVALLGANTPAVSNLSDIMAQYKLKFKNIGAQKCYNFETESLKIKKYSANKEATEMPENEIQTKLEQELKEFKEKYEAQTLELAAKAKELEDKDAKVQEFSIKIAEVEKEKAEAQLALEVESVMQMDGACPAMKEYVKELLGADKKSYSIDKKEYSKLDMVKELVKLTYAASKLNSKEQSIEGDKIPQGPDLVNEMEKYMIDNDCSRQEAYKYIDAKYKK